MSRPHRMALPLLVLSVLVAPLGPEIAGFEEKQAQAEDESVRDLAKLCSGMTPEQVRELVGAPRRIARQILYHRYREQWIYEVPLPLRLTFECRRGQKPRLLFSPRLPARKDRAAEKH